MSEVENEKFGEAVNDRAEELANSSTKALEWLADVADEDDVFEFAREAFLSLRDGKNSQTFRYASVSRRLLKQYANWCDERAREEILREARESREAGL